MRVLFSNPRHRGLIGLFITVSSHVCWALTSICPPSEESFSVDDFVTSLHGLPMMIFFSIAAHTAMQMAMEVRQDARDVGAPVIAVTGIAGLFYLCGYTRKLTRTSSVFPDATEYPLRYLMWIFTTPCVIISAGRNSDWDTSSINLIAAADILMIASGYAATLTVLGANVRLAAEVVSCLLFVVTIFGWVSLERSSHVKVLESLESTFGGKISKVKDERREAGYLQGKALLGIKGYVSMVQMISWCGFPLVWYLRKYGKMDRTTVEVVYVVLELVSKGVFAICESGISTSINHIIWECSMVQVVKQIAEQTVKGSSSQKDEFGQMMRSDSSQSRNSSRSSEDRCPAPYPRTVRQSTGNLSAKRLNPLSSGDDQSEDRQRDEFGQLMRSDSSQSRNSSRSSEDRCPAPYPRTVRQSTGNLSAKRLSPLSSGGDQSENRLSRPSSGKNSHGRLSSGGGIFSPSADEDINRWLRENTGTMAEADKGQQQKFAPRDLSRLPANFTQEGKIEILLVDSDMSEAAHVIKEASSMGATVTHCEDPRAVINLFSTTSRKRIVSSSSSSSANDVFASGQPCSLKETRKSRPDIVFFGHDDGWGDDRMELLSWLHTSFKGELPIIVLVTMELHMDANNDEMVSDMLANGASDFIVRPVHRVSIKTRVQNILEISKGRCLKRELEDCQNLLNRVYRQRTLDQLLSGQSVIADSHEDVTILFAGIVDFDELYSKIPTSEIILILNELFSEFDRAADLVDVYKVDSVADHYICASGVDETCGQHAERMIDMAKRMINAVKLFKCEHDIRIRIGIHTGNVYSGVVGRKCPKWCFYGETIRTASLMETTSAPMCIQISDGTREALHLDGSDVESVELSEHIVSGQAVKTHLIKHGDYKAALNRRSDGGAG